MPLLDKGGSAASLSSSRSSGPSTPSSSTSARRRRGPRHEEGTFRFLLNTARKIIEDEFTDVRLPREIVIKNGRLGIVHKIMQIIAFIIVLYYAIHAEIWYERFLPTGFRVIVWAEAASGPAANNTNVNHCTELASYEYVYSGSYTYSPARCVRLPPSDSFTKVGPILYIPTNIQDHTYWASAGDDCNNETERLCAEANNGVFRQGTYAEMLTYINAAGRTFGSPGTSGVPADLFNKTYCACSWPVDEFFSQNPEEIMIHFSHGYEVVMDPRGRNVQRGIITAPTYEEGSRHNPTRYQGEMLTVLQKPDGTPCVVNGKSVWNLRDVREGVKGTMREWLACDGATLDSNPNEIIGINDPNNAHHMRTMGGVIEFEMYWTNTPHTNVGDDVHSVCYVTVHVRPKWNSQTKGDSVHYPGVGQSVAMERFRYSYGMGVEFTKGGNFGFFDLQNFITAIVNTVVLLALPVYITQFIALYCIGIVSHIYRNAKRTPLDIYANFHGVASRMMVASAGYRGLTGGKWSGQASDIKDLTAPLVQKHLEDVFSEELANEALTPTDMHTLVNVIMSGLDADSGGNVSHEEFVRACTANDTMDMKAVVDFFDEQRPRGFMERLLDDTAVRKNARQKQLKKSKSAIEDILQAEKVEDTVVDVGSPPQTPNVVDASPAPPESSDSPEKVAPVAFMGDRMAEKASDNEPRTTRDTFLSKPVGEGKEQGTPEESAKDANSEPDVLDTIEEAATAVRSSAVDIFYNARQVANVASTWKSRTSKSTSGDSQDEGRRSPGGAPRRRNPGSPATKKDWDGFSTYVAGLKAPVTNGSGSVDGSTSPRVAPASSSQSSALAPGNGNGAMRRKAPRIDSVGAIGWPETVQEWTDSLQPDSSTDLVPRKGNKMNKVTSSANGDNYAV